MKWENPKLHDFKDLKDALAQGACSAGTLYDPLCNVGAVADTCTDGTDVDGGGGGDCSGGSAVG